MPSTPTPDPRRWWILGALSLALLVIGVDNTILNVAIPTIERDLGASTGAMQWIVDSYMLVFAGLLLTMGSLGDRFGRRRALFTGLVLFGISSTVAAFAESTDMLIAARASMGIGGALIMPATLSILMNVFPREEHAKAVGVWAAVFGLGVAVGPTGGGLLLEHFDWGAVFLVNIPIVAAALLVGSRLIPESRDPSTPPLDLPGAALSTLGLSTLVYGLIEAPSKGWAAGSTLVAFAAAAALLTAFVWRELTTEHPMLDVRLFRLPAFSAASGSLALASFALFGSIFFLTQHMQGVLGYSPLEAGVRLLPIAGGMIVAAPLSAVVAGRFGTRFTVALGMTGVAAGLAVMAVADAGNGYAPVALSMVLLSSGMGLSMAPATESVMSVLPLEKAGVGSAMNDTVRMVGGALGVAVLGSVLSTAYRGGMDDAPAAAQESVGAALAAGRDGALADQAIDAFVNGMHTTAIVAAAVALSGAVLAGAFLPRRARPTAPALVAEPAAA
ncbi:MAG TPA: MFS transporter [Solirubrobacteraceae bacterium]|jgi:EmrB/QacA subfamily drug resistance transporter